MMADVPKDAPGRILLLEFLVLIGSLALLATPAVLLGAGLAVVVGLATAIALRESSLGRLRLTLRLPSVTIGLALLALCIVFGFVQFRSCGAPSQGSPLNACPNEPNPALAGAEEVVVLLLVAWCLVSIAGIAEAATRRLLSLRGIVAHD